MWGDHTQHLSITATTRNNMDQQIMLSDSSRIEQKIEL